MRCIVTAGPTYEELDEVRRLTNFSTGRFGTLLGNFLADRGHQVTLLLGHYATCSETPVGAVRVERFGTSTSLREQLAAKGGSADALFHAAAVGDFVFGKVLRRGEADALEELTDAKIPTRAGDLLVELKPAPKIIHQLRGWYPEAYLVGWKYELDGDRNEVLARCHRQMDESKTNACVANGRAYGLGFGLLGRGASEPQHFRDPEELFRALEKSAIEATKNRSDAG